MTAATEVLTPARASVTQGRSAMRLFWERFREDKVALGAAVVIGILILLAIGRRADRAGAHRAFERRDLSGHDGELLRLAEGAERPLLVRGGRRCPRCLRTGHVRSEDLSDRRGGRVGDRGPDRARRRDVRRLLPRLARHAALARRRRDARDAAAPDLDRDRRRVQLEQERLRRRPDPARHPARRLRDRDLLLALHRPARARLHALDSGEGVRGGEPLARSERHRGSSSGRSCRTWPVRSSCTRRS